MVLNVLKVARGARHSLQVVARSIWRCLAAVRVYS